MESRYFVKFIGDKHVTVAIANSSEEANTLKHNQFEETTQSFYQWVQNQTRKVS